MSVQEQQVEPHEFDYPVSEMEKLVKIVLKALKFKDVKKLSDAGLLESLETRVVQNILSFVDELSYRTKKNKLLGIALKKVANIIHDLVVMVVNVELSPADMQSIIPRLEAAWEEAYALLNPPSEDDVSKLDTAHLFTLATKQAELHTQFFNKKKYPKGQAPLHRRIKGDVLMHCYPPINSERANMVGLQFRIVESYVHIKDQRLLIVNASAVEDPYQYARVVAIENGNDFVPVEKPFNIVGLSIFWFVKPIIISELFANAEINAWCCVKGGS